MLLVFVMSPPGNDVRPRFLPKLLSALSKNHVPHIVTKDVREMVKFAESGKLTGVIIPGSDLSVTNLGPRLRAKLNRLLAAIPILDVPVFGICFGLQTLCALYGGRVEKMGHLRKGLYTIYTRKHWLFNGCQGSVKGQFDHNDIVTSVPSSFRVIARDYKGAPMAIADENRKFYAVQFHPEECGSTHGIIMNFVKFCRNN